MNTLGKLLFLVGALVCFCAAFHVKDDAARHAIIGLLMAVGGLQGVVANPEKK